MESKSTRTDSAVEPADTLEPERAAIRDRRPLVRGQLPRQAQIWIMLGLATLILMVILITGRTEPSPRVTPSPAPTQPTAVAPERVRGLQDRLAEQELRARAAQAQLQSQPQPLSPVMPVVRESPAASPPPVDPAVDDRRRREEQSLFADNVAFTRRSSGAPSTTQLARPTTSSPQPALPTRPDIPASATPPLPSRRVGELPIAPPGESASPSSAKPIAPPTANAQAQDGWITLLESTVIEAVLVNRLDATFQGPVQCLVTTPVYSLDRQTAVVPAGARVLGTASPVQAWGDRRLAVSFHRLVMPDGTTYSLDAFPGLNQIGETGLHDQVNRHYLQVFGASLAIGAISGLAQVGTRNGFDQSASDASRQAAGASLATSTARVLDRYLNVLPTITIREGHRIKIVLTADLRLPPYLRMTAAGSPPPAASIPVSDALASGGAR